MPTAHRTLPARPRCPTCRQTAALVVHVRYLLDVNDAVALTMPCTGFDRTTRRQCRHPMALVLLPAQAPRYLFADTFPDLERLVARVLASNGRAS